MDYSWLLEKIDTESPGDTTVATGSTEAMLYFIIDFKDIYKAYDLILGWAKLSEKVWPNGRKGGLQRQVEMAHPRYPWMLADSIDIVGIKPNGNSQSEFLTVPSQIYNTDKPIPDCVNYKTFPFVADYGQARIGVKFSTKNYLPLTDDQLYFAIDPDRGLFTTKYDYYIKDNTQPSGVRDASYYDYAEYLRYTELLVEPDSEIITNTSGKGYYKSRDDNNPNVFPPNPPFENRPNYNSPININNATVIYQNITKNKIKIKWYKVPKIIITSPVLYSYASNVNYGGNYFENPTDFKKWNYPFFGFSSGTLLYTGFTYEDFNCSFPIIPFSGTTTEDLATNNLVNQYVNITFEFSNFVIPNEFLVRPNLNLINLVGGKQLTNGWNYAPQPNRLFYYCENLDRTLKDLAWPLYFSMPFQNMFNPYAVE